MRNLSNRRGAQAFVAALMTLFLLAACAEDEPAETQASPTTGETDTFEITGAVLGVDIEPVDATPSPTETDEEADEASPSPTATGSPTPSGPQQALLLLDVDSIDSATAELCDVSEGDSITLTVGVDAEVSPQREVDELGELEDLTVRAEGAAEELAEEMEGSPTPEEGEESPTPEEGATASPTGEEGAGCHYEVTVLTVIEQDDQTPSPRGDDAASEEGDEEEVEAEEADNGSPSPQREDGENGSPTPAQTATPTPTDENDGESPDASPGAGE